jgi:hypothetical protein
MPNDKEKPSGQVVTLRDRYLIYPSSPIPELSSEFAQAFAAEDRRERDKAVFAILVKPGIPARIPALRLLKGVDNPGLMPLVEWGVADWPPANRKAMLIVYLRPTGGRVWDEDSGNFRRFEESDAINKLIKPVESALKTLKSLGLTHRSIRPGNMFWATPDKDRVVLGDCCATPPAFEQPASLEPVESALAMPSGRGDGYYSNDVYAFGASLSVLLQGRNNTANSTDDAVIRHKMVLGSYSALCGEARLPLSLVEILRGTLCDDAQDRWDVEGIDLWLSGRRLTPLVPRFEKRAIRSFPLSGVEYMTARELAMGIHKNWDTALPQLGESKLELWMSRALDNKDKATAIAGVMGAEITAIDRRMVSDVTIAKLCMLLDPTAPIRYKGISVMIDGFRWALPAAMATGGDVRTIAEALMRELPKAWMETREAYSPDNSVMESGFRTQKGYLDRGTIGNGLERVLYEMNDAVPCLSPMLVDDYVVELRDLLPALNNYAKKKGDSAGGTAVDRHVAAFIAARATFDVERIITDLSSSDPARSVMTMINLLAMIQWRLGQSGMTHLTLWLAHLAKPATRTFHNRAKRRQMEEELPRVGRDGNIVEMSRLLDSADDKGADYRGFEEAKVQWSDCYRQAKAIVEGHEELHEEAARTGQQIASLISITAAFITVTFLLIGMVF